MKPTLDLTPDQQNTLLALLDRHLPGIAVWAYGSRIKGTARTNSDLDLVAFTTPEERPLVSAAREALEESDLPFVVDLHFWTQAPEQFYGLADQEHVIVQAAALNRATPRSVAPST